MENWRFLDTAQRGAAENIALDAVLLESVSQKHAPNTLRFLQFSPACVLVGAYQTVEDEVREDYCQKHGIEINRRLTGGGTIFFDPTQIGWEIIAQKSFFKFSLPDERLYEILTQPIIKALRAFGIPASFRPRNDVEVQGRKISGTGGVELGEAFLFQGTLLVDFDVETMLRVLKIPVEKLRKHEIASLGERVTWLTRELSKPPSVKALKRTLKKAFEEEFKISLTNGSLSPEEKRAFLQKKREFSDKAWIYRIKKPRSGFIKALSPSVTVWVKVDHSRIKEIFFLGDFFSRSQKDLLLLEAYLKNTPLNIQEVTKVLHQFFNQYPNSFSGITLPELVTSLEICLDKLKYRELGFESLNRLFLIQDTLSGIILKKPRIFLLPYCAKSSQCKFRHTKKCWECGKCHFGKAHSIIRKFGLKPLTILNYADLITTLKKEQKPYIGCCCEGFYKKHNEALTNLNLPGLLVDISGTTCYDLGKEKEALAGKFEGESQLEIQLIEKVLKVIENERWKQ